MHYMSITSPPIVKMYAQKPALITSVGPMAVADHYWGCIHPAVGDLADTHPVAVVVQDMACCGFPGSADKSAQKTCP